MISNPHLQWASAERSHLEAVYFVDDRPSDLHHLCREVEDLGYRIHRFQDPREFLESLSTASVGCLVTDHRLPIMNGLELFNEVEKRKLQLTTVILTGVADVKTCRDSLRLGVFDFIEKSASTTEIVTTIQHAMRHNRAIRMEHAQREVIKKRIGNLTQRELEVANLLSEGKTLKEVGNSLDISTQTASKHRSKVFTKLGVENEVELYRSFGTCEAAVEELLSGYSSDFQTAAQRTNATS